jgi:hypothetical protein
MYFDGFLLIIAPYNPSTKYPLQSFNQISPTILQSNIPYNPSNNVPYNPPNNVPYNPPNNVPYNPSIKYPLQSALNIDPCKNVQICMKMGAADMSDKMMIPVTK